MLTTLLSAGASVLTIAVTAFFMNSRQTFYSLTFVDEFEKMGRRKLYMIHTMTDEMYAVNCTLELKDEEKRQVMFGVAFFSRCYWMTGAVAGYVLLAILVSAIITFGLRALPFVLFHGDRKTPEWLDNLGANLPSAIMAVLIVYCLRSAKSDFVGNGISGITAVLVVAISYKWKHNTFLSIIAGTVVYMALIRVM